MEIRKPAADDCERIRAVARSSFQSSYALSPQEIETILEASFSDEALAERFDDPETVFLVAEHATEETPEVNGLIDVRGEAPQTIHWLHVDPQARGAGIGTALIEQAREGEETPLVARILETAVEGNEFVERFGLERDDSDGTEFGGDEFAVTVFTREGEAQRSNEPDVTVPDSIPVDGADRFVDGADPVPGRGAPFFQTYSDEAHEKPYGFFCSQCGSTEVATDGLDGLECSNCGNVHRPDEYDDAYL